ncbi:MAG: tyrosine-type recombinase/integrase [Armatimonadetes bacterium]|nr:tyrosine-type recombinase/integrase [Armatimonadota bacterium]
MSRELAVRLGGWVEELLLALRHRGYAERTLRTYGSDLRDWLGWVADREDLQNIADLTRPVLSAYQQHLFARAPRRSSRARRLSASTQQHHLAALRALFRFLVREGVALVNPALELDMPRTPRRLPRIVLTEKEVLRMLMAVDLSTALGWRNRAGLELLYGTGIRRSEFLGARLTDLELQGGWLRVLGKGDRERVVPLGREARRALVVYLEKARPELAPTGVDELFVSRRGGPLGGREFDGVLTRCARQAGLKKPVSFHTLRHTCATHLLRGRADIRYIQTLLGGTPASTPRRSIPGSR